MKRRSATSLPGWSPAKPQWLEIWRNQARGIKAARCTWLYLLQKIGLEKASIFRAESDFWSLTQSYTLWLSTFRQDPGQATTLFFGVWEFGAKQMPKLQQIESHVHIRCVFSCQVGFIWLERYLPNLTLISSTPFFLRWSSSLQSCPVLDAGPTPASFAGGWWSSLPVWKKNFNSSASTSESSWIIHGEWVPELPSNEAPSTAGGASTYPCILLSQELRNKYCVESKRNWYNAPPFSIFPFTRWCQGPQVCISSWRHGGELGYQALATLKIVQLMLVHLE